MAKKTVYICDGKDCGAVLVNPEDGFVLTGELTTTTISGEPKVLVASPAVDVGQGTQTSLCRECMAEALGLHL